MNLANPPPTRGLPLPEGPRPPLAGERRSLGGAVPQPLRAGGPAAVLSAIDRHLAQARRSGQPLAVLALRMNRLSSPEHAPGASQADALVLAFGQRLRARVRSSDTVLWQGDSEWVALLQPCRHAGALAARQRLLGVLSEPYRLGQEDWRVSASIGCACHPAAGDTSALLLGAALAGRG